MEIYLQLTLRYTGRLIRWWCCCIIWWEGEMERYRQLTLRHTGRLISLNLVYLKECNACGDIQNLLFGIYALYGKFERFGIHANACGDTQNLLFCIYALYGKFEKFRI